MSGAHALREEGPSGLRRAALCVWVAAAGVTGGCAPPAAPLPAVAPGVAPVADAAGLAALESALASSGRPDSIAAAALRAAGLTPPFERRFVLDAGGRALVAGLVPGGVPGLRDSLVVAIALGPAAGAALLEAARWVAERAAYQPGPARTLMVALVTSNGSIETDATSALTRTLSTPLWDAGRVSTIVMVGPASEAAAGAARERSVSLRSVDHTTPGELALETYAALLDATAGRQPVPPDTTSVHR
jgi:hypothetical protein